jgi:hypothetical protein
MFEKHHAKKLADAYELDLSVWKAERATRADLLSMAETFTGDTSRDSGLVLEQGEALFATVTSVSLIEERRTGGHYQGDSHGVSIPVGSIGGRSVRYHVGASRGHYVQGTPAPTAIDSGTVYVTNKRVVFTGDSQTLECRFDKLLSCQATAGATTFSVSNRQKPTTIHYGAELDGWFAFRLELALANYRGTVPDLVQQLTTDLAELDAHQPRPPAPLAP